MDKQPTNYTLDSRLVGDDYVSVAVPLDRMMNPRELTRSPLYRRGYEQLQALMAEKGWVKGDVPLSESKTLRPIHVNEIVDKAVEDGRLYLFIVAVGFKTEGRKLFIDKRAN